MAQTSPDSNLLHDLARNLKLEKDLVDSPWFKALESRNCMTLKGLLKTHKDLVRRTSHGGRTVLHVAVIQGCLDLVEYILRLFGDGLEPATFKARYQVLLTAKDGRCGGVTALGVAQEFLGMEKIIQCLQLGPSHNQQAAPNAQDDQSLRRVREIISEVFTTKPMFDSLKASFGQDVDYNFHNIENNAELVFHHAFSQIGMEESQEESKSMKFVLKVMKKCLAQVELGVTTLRFLFKLRNAQGRPPFHALLVSSDNDYARSVPKVNDLIIRIKLIDRISKKGVDLILEAIEKALDADGRTFCHWNVPGIIQQLFLTEPMFDSLKASFGVDADYDSYNIENNAELVFHHAFSQIGMEESQEESESMKFVLKVMEECLAQGEVGSTTLKLLFNLLNAQGRPPFHALLASRDNDYARSVLKVNDLIIRIESIDRISKKGVDLIHEAIEKALDADGRTFCHPIVHDIIQQLFLTVPMFDSLKASFGEDVDYNFHNIENNAELVFHHAFSQIGMEESQEESESMKFVLKVMEECLAQGKVGVSTLKFLFNLPNAQGRPPFHALFASSKNGYSQLVYVKVNNLIDRLFREHDPPAGLEACVTALDAKGRTLFHRNVSMKPNEGLIHYVFDHLKVAKFTDVKDLLKKRMKSRQVEGSPKDGMGGEGGATALHLAILHNQHLNVVKLLEDTYDVDLNAIFYRRIQYGHDATGKGARWSPLQLAALLGNPHIVQSLLAKVEKIYDVGKWKNSKSAKKPYFYDEKMPAVHLAAASGNYEVLRLFLNKPQFNHMKTIDLSKGTQRRKFQTTLHLAADETIPSYRELSVDFDACSIFKNDGIAVSLVDIDNHHMIQSNSIFQDDGTDSSKTIMTKVYIGKQQSMTMILEYGLEMWRKGENGDFPEPRWKAPDGENHWWHDKVRMQVNEAKRNLREAGNAISVVAGLIATASYVGPLQPPLGFESPDSVVQVHDNMAVRVFVVSNSCSFVFAVVALMISLMPSVPVTQENLFDEWRYSRGIVSTSLMALLFSVSSILVSFASANCAGMPDYKSVLQSYAFYPSVMFGLLCIVAIGLCFIRVLRLIKPQNKTIASIHRECVRVIRYCQ